MDMMDPRQEQEQRKVCLFDSLFCEEECWEEDEEGLNEEEEEEGKPKKPSLLPILLVSKQDMFWEDEELQSLLSKEQETHFIINDLETNQYLESVRKEAIDQILTVISHYSFSPLTAILSVNYLDRFLSSTLHFQRDKPWMTQLVSVACLSLAAKVEETQVPLLFDLQVVETKFVFEPKTIQKMELLILSTLQWRMNPVTPFSYFDHIIRRLELKNNPRWEFLQKCEHLLLLVVSDSRVFRYRPSVLATTIMLHVIDHVETDDPLKYQNQLMGVLKFSKGEIDDCYEFIQKAVRISHYRNKNNKKKYDSVPNSPHGVIELSFSCESLNESPTLISSVSSSPEKSLLFKKRRTQEDQLMG